MKRVRLEIFSRDEVTRVAKLVWTNGFLEEDFAELGRSDLHRIVESGLHEWVGEAPDRLPRVTPAGHPRFLHRLAAYVRKNYGLITSLESERLQFVLSQSRSTVAALQRGWDSAALRVKHIAASSDFFAELPEQPALVAGSGTQISSPVTTQTL